MSFFQRLVVCLCGLLSVTSAFEISYKSQGLIHIPNGLERGISHLILSVNNIQDTSADDFNGLTALKILDFDHNLLTKFPDLTQVSTSLQELDIAHNKITEILENDLEILQQLTLLRLDSNKLVTLPDVQGPSGTLHTLLATGNCFNEFPSFHKLGKTLTRLDLQHNNISKMPLENTAGLDSIKYLSVGANQLKVFPDLSNIAATLKYLDLSYNFIDTVPASHFVLTNSRQVLVIKLNSNELSSVPSPGCKLDNVHIWLEGNPLHCDDRIAWLLSTTGVRETFYDYVYQDYDFTGDEGVAYYNTLSRTTCASPPALADKTITDLTYTDLGITEDMSGILARQSVSAGVKTDTYKLGVPISRQVVLSRLECQVVCMYTPGCRFYNLRVEADGSLCDYSDPLHGTLPETQPNGGAGWTVYSSDP